MIPVSSNGVIQGTADFRDKHRAVAAHVIMHEARVSKSQILVGQIAVPMSRRGSAPIIMLKKDVRAGQM